MAIETTEQLLAAWDAGQTVTTVEMGGLGEGYEHALQITGFECIRYMLANPPDWESYSTEEGREAWRDYVDAMDEHVLSNDPVSSLGISGAMWGAAVSLAAVIVRQGYRAALGFASVDRLIEIKR